MTIKEIYDSGEGQPICKMELDLQNVAKGSAVYIDDVLNLDAEVITDGHRAHIDSSGQAHYFETEDSEFNLHLAFSGLKTINRLNIFWYPKSTLVGAISGNVAADFFIYYATTQTDGLPTGWVRWNGLQDRSLEIGQTATTIVNGSVINNENTYNSFIDLAGVSAYGVRIHPAEVATPVRLCQIEVWESIELNDFLRFDLNKKRDNILGIFHSSIGKGTQIAATEEFYPHKGKFKNIDKDNIPEMPARIYGGLNKQGVDLWDIQGHFWVFDWTIFKRKKRIEFKVKDRIKVLKDTKVFLGIETLKDKNREWLIEWMALEAGISADEVSLFETERTVQMFYPVNSPIWDEMNEISKGLGDVSLFIDNHNILHWEVYSNPHKWYMPDDTAWATATFINTEIIDNKVKPFYSLQPSTLPADFVEDQFSIFLGSGDYNLFVAGVIKGFGIQKYRIYRKTPTGAWTQIVEQTLPAGILFGRFDAIYKNNKIFVVYFTEQEDYLEKFHRIYLRTYNETGGQTGFREEEWFPGETTGWNELNIDVDSSDFAYFDFSNIDTDKLYWGKISVAAGSYEIVKSGVIGDAKVLIGYGDKAFIIFRIVNTWYFYYRNAPDDWLFHSKITDAYFQPLLKDFHIIESGDIGDANAIVVFSRGDDNTTRIYYWSTHDMEWGFFEIDSEDKDWSTSPGFVGSGVDGSGKKLCLFIPRAKGSFNHLVRNEISYTGHISDHDDDWTVEKSTVMGLSYNTNCQVRRVAMGKHLPDQTENLMFAIEWNPVAPGFVFVESPANFVPINITSPTKDLNTDIFHSGVLNIDCYLFDNLIIKTYTRTSDNEIDWDGWELINDDGTINSTAKRYFQWKVVFESSGLVYGDIALSSAYFFWATGIGTARFKKIDWSFSSANIEEIPISFANEDKGEKIKYSKVEIKANPFILNVSAKIWDGDIGWMAETGKSYNYNVVFEKPVEVDAAYKLKINGHYYPEGESTYGGIIVNFTRHPISPQVLITGVSNTNITEYFIEGKEWTQTSGRIYSVGEGIETLQIENKYLSDSFLSQDTANKIYRVLSKIIVGVRREMILPYCPTMDLDDVIKIEDNELDITRFYQVLEISHDIREKKT
ncbi:MAG: hypothetical protein ACTSRC_21940, partial [Candidatus Helarchaeota archaeon]